ncbi:myb-related protein Myb4 [Corchorus capsularis]|uniref:Myb-related protein Myb4 n=1 Tax=Corchorus capsularis TaxID=210143 RepID=A0A1R3G9R2_COCAP|nr:myb-related protein Myb4 [Corchorus capsularis]
MSPQPSSSEVSSITNASTTTTTETMDDIIKTENMDSWEYFPEIDESFWSDAMSSDNSVTEPPLSFEGVFSDINEFQSQQQQFPSASSTSSIMDAMDQPDYGYDQNLDDGMEFWYDLFIKAGGEQELITNQF